jgi:glyoxylase-like metal-dependent hydrolase (beta-lactamase superfamily II)
MKIETITVSAFSMNCYLVIDEESREAIYIDPGAEADLLIEKISDFGVNLTYIINTHGHIDHTAEVSKVKKYFNIPFYMHQGDQSLLEALPAQGNIFGMAVQEIPEVTEFINEGDVLEFGNIKPIIIHTPGHSPGGVSIKIDNNVFVGDCLFLDSIGRTDLPGGDYQQLIQSIREKLLTLPDLTIVYPGHGPSTTIGRERLHNPFLQFY